MVKWSSAFLRHSRWVTLRSPPAICRFPHLSQTVRPHTEQSPRRRDSGEPQCGHMRLIEPDSATPGSRHRRALQCERRTPAARRLEPPLDILAAAFGMRARCRLHSPVGLFADVRAHSFRCDSGHNSQSASGAAPTRPAARHRSQGRWPTLSRGHRALPFVDWYQQELPFIASLQPPAESLRRSSLILSRVCRLFVYRRAPSGRLPDRNANRWWRK